MVGQVNQDIERKINAIFRILSSSTRPLGSLAISRQLEDQGIHLGERAVRYHLKLMDERGFTHLVGPTDGRSITNLGLEEMKNSLVTDKIGFVDSLIERLAYQTSVCLDPITGSVPIDVSLFRKQDFQHALKIMNKVFDSGLCSSKLVALAEEGSKLGDVTIPPNKIGFAVVCNVAVNGCLLKSGIPVYSRFGGLLQMRDGKPLRFVDLIEFSGSTIDPIDIFISGKMTTVDQAAFCGNGNVLASYIELPALSTNKADELLKNLKANNLLTCATLGKQGDRICEIPFNHDKVGLITLSGLNPVAAVVEAGIEVVYRAMGGMSEVTALRPYSELGKRDPAKRNILTVRNQMDNIKE